mmetsp:Transcript_10886/g.13498  ORF Transcript_10886/g.13498 Transcript_10886/m.13498 type:complete len:205 (-) Transcript_10886:404-1018(-)
MTSSVFISLYSLPGFGTRRLLLSSVIFVNASFPIPIQGNDSDDDAIFVNRAPRPRPLLAFSPILAIVASLFLFRSSLLSSFSSLLELISSSLLFSCIFLSIFAVVESPVSSESLADSESSKSESSSATFVFFCICRALSSSTCGRPLICFSFLVFLIIIFTTTFFFATATFFFATTTFFFATTTFIALFTFIVIPVGCDSRQRN